MCPGCAGECSRRFDCCGRDFSYPPVVFHDFCFSWVGCFKIKVRWWHLSHRCPKGSPMDSSDGNDAERQYVHHQTDSAGAGASIVAWMVSNGFLRFRFLRGGQIVSGIGGPSNAARMSANDVGACGLIAPPRVRTGIASSWRTLSAGRRGHFPSCGVTLNAPEASGCSIRSAG